MTVPWTKFLLPIKGSHCSYLNLTSHCHQRCFFYHWLFSSYQEARGWTCNCWSTPLQGCLISYILVGLETDYESLIYTLIARSNTLTLEDVYSFSLTSESQLNYHKQATPIINANANIATKQSSQTYGQGYNEDIQVRGRGVITMVVIIPTLALDSLTAPPLSIKYVKNVDILSKMLSQIWYSLPG